MPWSCGTGCRGCGRRSTRLVAETIRIHHLEAEERYDPDGWQSVDPRHATLHRDEVHYAGTLRLEAELDIADALDLDLAHGAATRAALGSTASLDARRAAALRDLARTQTALDLRHPRSHPRPRGSGNDQDGLPVAREVVLHAHFTATTHSESADADGPAVTVFGPTLFGPTGRLEEGQRLVLLDQVQAWCGSSRTTVTITPVIDLTTELTAPGYKVPDRIREHVVLRDGTCVFPHCTRPARGCDIDHVIPHDHDADAEGRPQPGPTRTSNLAALCRFHHRLKTHTAWHYEMTGPGAFEWTSPHAHRYRRDHTGTTPLEQIKPPEPHDRP